MSEIFRKLQKQYKEEADRLAYKSSFLYACSLLRTITEKVAQGKAITDQLLDGMYITFYDESEEDIRWLYVGYLEGDDEDGLDIVKGINLAKLEMDYFDLDEIILYTNALEDETSFSYENTCVTIEEQILIAINAIKDEINEHEG